jgi:hypothetical protein
MTHCAPSPIYVLHGEAHFVIRAGHLRASRPMPNEPLKFIAHLGKHKGIAEAALFDLTKNAFFAFKVKI